MCQVFPSTRTEQNLGHFNTQVIAQIQADIARNDRARDNVPIAQSEPTGQSRIVDITAIPDAVFLRPTSHYDIPTTTSKNEA